MTDLLVDFAGTATVGFVVDFTGNAPLDPLPHAVLDLSGDASISGPSFSVDLASDFATLPRAGRGRRRRRGYGGIHVA